MANTGSGDLKSPFLFVKGGDPEPLEWMSRHSGWVKFPATMVPEQPASAASRDAPPTPAAALAATAAAAPGFAEVMTGEGVFDIFALLAELTPLFTALGILYPAQTADPKHDELSPDLPARPARGANDGLVPPPPAPPLPGLVPPTPGTKRSAGDSGLTPPPPPSPLPGFTPASPLPNVLPGRRIDEARPTVVQNEHKGLGGGSSRTRSERARRAARTADPAVPKVLQDAEWQAHHLINIAGLREYPDLIREAARAGWRTDDARNFAPLPASTEARAKLGAAGIHRPVHDNGHPNWNDEVRAGLEHIESKLRKDAVTPGTDAYAQGARKGLEQLQDELRQTMYDLDRLTQNEATGQPVLA